MATNTGMFSSAPGRAAGSVLGLILWLALTGLAGVAATGRRSRSLAQATLVLAGVVASGLSLTDIDFGLLSRLGQGVQHQGQTRSAQPSIRVKAPPGSRQSRGGCQLWAADRYLLS